MKTPKTFTDSDGTVYNVIKYNGFNEGMIFEAMKSIDSDRIFKENKRYWYFDKLGMKHRFRVNTYYFYSTETKKDFILEDFPNP